MANMLSLTLFLEQLHSRFRVHGSRMESTELALVEAIDHGSTTSQENFTLLFRGSNHEPLPQQIYRLEHPALGLFDLFLVPVGRDGQGTLYEAIINRLR